MVPVDGVRVSGGGMHFVVWHQDPYQAAVVTRSMQRRWRRWQVLVYDGPPIPENLIVNEFRFTRGGALSTMAKAFAVVGVSVRAEIPEAMKEARDGSV